MASYLITGGAGFIGSNLAHSLVALGEKVRILDNFSSGREENIADLLASHRVELVRGDVANPLTAQHAVEGVDYVLHQAAIPSVPRSIEDPISSDWVNVHGTVVLLHAAHKAKVKRVVYAASSSAYGERAPNEAKIETMVPDPLSPYAAAKLAGEHYVKAFFHSFGLETVALRYFNVFGPRQDPKSQYAAVIPNFVTAALDGRPATIFGDGNQSRDFCYIDNVVEANLLACRAPSVAGEVFNVACGESTTLLEVVRAIAEIVGRSIAPRHEPPRTGDIRHSLSDIGKARRLLGYTGKVRFREGLARTVAWYQESR
jgi:UDP-N-acetylglucosamine 4-epimerase